MTPPIYKGASRKQAIAALAKHKTLNEAAEAIFSGEFEPDEEVPDEEEVVDDGVGQDDDGCVVKGINLGSKGSRHTSEERDEAIDDTANLDGSGDDDGERFWQDKENVCGLNLQDSFCVGFDLVSNASHASYQDADPYLGLCMDKDREELVIEIVEEPNTFTLDLASYGNCVKAPKHFTAKEITQSEWLRGCPEGGEQTVSSGLESSFMVEKA